MQPCDSQTELEVAQITSNMCLTSLDYLTLCLEHLDELALSEVWHIGAPFACSLLVLPVLMVPCIGCSDDAGCHQLILSAVASHFASGKPEG